MLYRARALRPTCTERAVCCKLHMQDRAQVKEKPSRKSQGKIKRQGSENNMLTLSLHRLTTDGGASPQVAPASHEKKQVRLRASRRPRA